jgi:hypothetical protein
MSSIEKHITKLGYLAFSCDINYPISSFVWGHLGTLARLHGYNLSLKPTAIQGDEAIKLADALTLALDDIPEFDAVAETKRDFVLCPDGEIRLGIPNHEDVNALEWFSYDGGQNWLKDFIINVYFHRGFDYVQNSGGAK